MPKRCMAEFSSVACRMDACRFVSERVMEFDMELDARKLSCPLPILRTKKSLSQMASGQVLKVLATDPESPKDFVVFCRQTGNELLSSAGQDGEFVFLIRRR